MNLAEASMTNLADLPKLSKQVNEQSDQVNQVLQDLEKKLVAMNLGVETWVQPEVTSGNALNVKLFTDGGGHWSEDQILGFGRFGDRSMLLVKTLTFQKRYEEDDQEGYWDYHSESAPRPLLQASREIRIKALDKIEDLLDALRKEAEAVLESIKKGRKTVHKL